MAAKRAAKKSSSDHVRKSDERKAQLRANESSSHEEVDSLVEPSAHRDIVGVLLAVVAVASFIAVVSSTTAPVTHAIASFYHLGFGLGAYVLPIVLLFFAASLFLKDRTPFNGRTLAGGCLIFFSAVSFLSLLAPDTTASTAGMFEPAVLSSTGGYVGASIASALQGAFGKAIAGVIIVGVLIVGFVIVGFSVSSFFREAASRAHDLAERHNIDINAKPWGDDSALSVPAAPQSPRMKPLFSGFADKTRVMSATESADPLGANPTRLIDDDSGESEDPFVDLSDQLEKEHAKTALLPLHEKLVTRNKRGKAAADKHAETLNADESPIDSDVSVANDASASSPAAADAGSKRVAPSHQSVKVGDTGKPIPTFLLNALEKTDSSKMEPVSLDHKLAGSDDSVEPAKTAQEVQSSDASDDDGELKLPPLTMLRHNPKSATSASSDKELEQTAEALQSTLQEFGRTARVVGWISGPTVTTFKLQPGEGERVSKITALEDDIALSLAAQSVRIFAPIPGTSLVGIEIPNRTRQNVYLGDVMPYVKGGPLELAIGRDSEGTPIVADLAKMPHLLIAGTTGSGKSVMINSIITDLLMRARPDDVRLIMVDPKRVELAGYNGLPHLYVPVVTEPKQAASALQWAVSEMERRLKVFEKLNVRKISTYNQKQAAGEFNHYDNPPKKMPYLVIIIDELSDLMMVAGKDVEASIVRIAQLGRAAGIHLIVATQRPSSNVVTGLIKANITNRIAFNVATGIDSRVIIDQMGAEKLTGLGDMLFSKVDWGKPRRIQGCFVSDEEINEVVDYVKSQSEPDYHEEILSVVSPAAVVSAGAGPVRSGTAEPQDDDPLIWEAAQIVVETQLGSTSGLQRRLKVGYARAGRIMDMLEEKGVVGPPDGSKPREVLLDEEGLEALKSVDAEMAAEDDLFGGF